MGSPTFCMFSSYTSLTATIKGVEYEVGSFVYTHEDIQLPCSSMLVHSTILLSTENARELTAQDL